MDTDVVRCEECCFEGGWRDFAFALRNALGSFGTPVAVLVTLGLEASVSRRLPLLKDGTRPIWGCVLSPVDLDIPSKLFVVGSMPGPTLLRGARAAGLGGAWAGNWL